MELAILKKEKRRAYLAANRVRETARRKAYYEAHKESAILWAKEYYQNNKDKFRANYKKWYWKDSRNRITASMAARIHKFLKNGVSGRSWESLVGYSLDELRSHLEGMFLDGMKWENYGEWHIDHIIPLAVFQFNDVEHPDFKKAWALSNLQPLWATNNKSKSDKTDKPFQPSLRLEPWIARL
ncbi:MAG: hypothetical protein PHV74_14990 [Dehalococcoidia bacterium]|nr:hypothetical protein [Dehalococcoidia bacterium]